MRQHLKFLLPDITTANLAAKELLLAKVDNKNITFLAKPGTDLGELQTVSTLESTNAVNKGEKGILIGATIGLVFGLFTHYFQPWITESINVHWTLLVGVLMLFGATISAIGAAIFGSNSFNKDLEKYKNRVDAGAVLMIVVSPFQRTNEITQIIHKLYLRY